MHSIITYALSCPGPAFPLWVSSSQRLSPSWDKDGLQQFRLISPQLPHLSQKELSPSNSSKILKVSFSQLGSYYHSQTWTSMIWGSDWAGLGPVPTSRSRWVSPTQPHRPKEEGRVDSPEVSMGAVKRSWWGHTRGAHWRRTESALGRENGELSGA